MLDEDKIRVMTGLAVFEKDKGQQAMIASRYYKGDYVSYHMIWTAISSTVAYLLLLFLVIFARLEYFMSRLQSLNVQRVCLVIGLSYVAFLLCFQVVAFVLYRGRFRKAEKLLSEYCDGLKALEKVYNKGRTRQGQTAPDDIQNMDVEVSHDEFVGD